MNWDWGLWPASKPPRPRAITNRDKEIEQAAYEEAATIVENILRGTCPATYTASQAITDAANAIRRRALRGET